MSSQAYTRSVCRPTDIVSRHLSVICQVEEEGWKKVPEIRKLRALRNFLIKYTCEFCLNYSNRILRTAQNSRNATVLFPSVAVLDMGK